MQSLFRLLTLLLLSALSAGVSATNVLDLSGSWQVRLGNDTTQHAIQLPGTTDAAGLGVPNTLKPALSKPQLLRLTRKNSYVGPAVYTRTIDIPRKMAGKPLKVMLERVMWKSRLTVDGVPAGTVCESLTTPHRFVLPEGLSAGRHTLTLEIDNSKHYEISGGNLGHAYTNDTQIMWNGVLGEMTLSVIPEIGIADVQIYPDVRARKARVRVSVENKTARDVKDRISWSVSGAGFSAPPLNGKTTAQLKSGLNTLEFECNLGNTMKEWSEFTPNLYTLVVSSAKSGDSHAVNFGMRQIESRDGKLLLNGQPVFLRGTLECCIFPLTGTPPLDEAGWEKVFDTAAEWGLNHLRFHSWCPPEAAFAVADRKGFYLQVELPIWSTSIGKDTDTKNFIAREYDRIVKEYGNHPSFCLMTVGNELQYDFTWLNSMVKHMQATDPRHLYAATSFTFENGHGGHPEPHDSFIVTQWTDAGWVRGQGVFNSEPPSFNKDYSSSMKPISIPLISHEIGQYAVYPDLREIDRYTGVLDPLNFKAVRNDLAQKGRLHKAGDYLMASGKLAAILYKEEIERALKTPGFSGFQLLGLQDFSGQGTALVGLVNAFWDSKGIVEASWFRQFNSPVVPLARFEKATYYSDEHFTADIEIANYRQPMRHPVQVNWSLRDGKELFGSGTLKIDSLPIGIHKAGHFDLPLRTVKNARQLLLTVSITGTGWHNEWPVWVYPRLNTVDYGQVIATQNPDEALQALSKGRRVLFSPVAASLKGLESKFVPVFWSPVHFPNQAGGMGILCNPAHPALTLFPTEAHTNWQWWHLVKNAKVVHADSLRSMTPIIEVVDNFTNNRPLGLLFEAQCANGTLLFSAIDLLSSPQSDPATHQLLESLLRYMNSAAFHPSTSIAPQTLKQALIPPPH